MSLCIGLLAQQLSQEGAQGQIAGTSGPVISEFMASNETKLVDAFMATSDWIELHNPGTAAVDMTGWYLANSKTNLRKWRFPAVTIPPGAYLVVHASNRDLIDPAKQLHTNFTLDPDGEYLALVRPDGVTIRHQLDPFPRQFEDVSGGVVDGAQVFFTTPSPGAVNSTATIAGPIIGEPIRQMARPLAGPLLITARPSAVNAPLATLKLFYLKGYETEASIDMKDDGLNGDAVAGDGLWSAMIPSTHVAPGQMTRWFYRATDTAGKTTREPANNRNTAEVPAYWGTVGAESPYESKLPVLLLFMKSPSSADTILGERGSVYYLNEFYDHVFFKIHGQSTAGANFPKKSWNVDFTSAQHFRWSPDFKRVKDMDLLTNWGDKSKIRHTLAYEMFRNIGVPTHHLFPVRVHLNGAFHAISDFIENGDSFWLERAGLNKNGALYKMGSNLASGTQLVAEQKTRKQDPSQDDLEAFQAGIAPAATPTAKATFLYDNLDIATTINVAAGYFIGAMTDFGHKNYYLYRDTGGTNEWAYLPWDLDLSFGRRWNVVESYFDDNIILNHAITNTNSNVLLELLNTGDFATMLGRRQRTLRDKWVQPAAVAEANDYLKRRMTELADLLDPPEFAMSDAKLDFAKWGTWQDLASGRTLFTKSGNNVAGSSTSDNDLSGVFTGLDNSTRGAINRLKSEYLEARRTFVYGNSFPAAQLAAPDVKFVITAGGFEINPVSANQDEEYLSIRNNSTAAVDLSGFKILGGVQHTFKPGTVILAGRTMYLSPAPVAFRARKISPKQGESRFVQGPYSGHLSNLGETLTMTTDTGVLLDTLITPPSPSPAQRHLVISEVMFNPDAAQPEAEFIELLNTSASETLNLTDVKFGAGVEFTFTGGAVMSLMPGKRVLVVRNKAAFRAVYGNGWDDIIAGEFLNFTALSNGGELLKLDDNTNSTVVEFTYDNKAPWPNVGPAAVGYSMVLRADAADPQLGAAWRFSARKGGSPGAADIMVFTGAAMGDTDMNGQADLLDYAQGWSLPSAVDRLSGAELQGASAAITYQLNVSAEDVILTPQVSTDLITWEGAAGVFGAAELTPNGDGTATVRQPLVGPAGAKRFFRLKVSLK